MDPISLIHKLNSIASPYGVGRDIHVGDTIIGIKGRVAFEAAAPLILIKSHHLLEKHTLTKGQLYWKDQLAGWYGQLMHEAQYLDPVMRNIELFLEETQKNVCGTVEVELNHIFCICLRRILLNSRFENKVRKYSFTGISCVH
jgi:argininosuccinate synthase